jgi:hypothetical protein
MSRSSKADQGKANERHRAKWHPDADGSNNIETNSSSGYQHCLPPASRRLHRCDEVSLKGSASATFLVALCEAKSFSAFATSARNALTCRNCSARYLGLRSFWCFMIGVACCLRKRGRRTDIIARRLRPVDPTDLGRSGNETRSLSLMSRLRINSGTAQTKRPPEGGLSAKRHYRNRSRPG